MITAVPVAGVALLGLLLRWFTGQLEQDRAARRRAREAGRPAAPARRPHRPIEVVAADLRRLTRELALVPSGTPVARRRGLQAAYDDVLIEVAELLEVPHDLTRLPTSGRGPERERLLAALVGAGLVVER
jgi:hypothetical protein